MVMDTQQMEKSGNSAPRVAVIILNWNGSKLLREYLPKVVATTDPALCRIIVADNGSSDDSVDYLRKEWEGRVELMLFDRNYGFAEGYNKAVALAAGYDYVVLLNSDVATSKGWDTALFNYMENHADVGACQPKILAYKHPNTFEYAGASGGYLDCDGYPYCRGRIFDVCEKDLGQYDDVADIFWASGACLMTRPKLYLEAGGLDKDFFAHMEEIDLCWRIRLLGYRVVAIPSGVVYHLGGGSLPAENPRKTYLNFRNNLLMLHKNLPDGVRGRKLFRRRLLDTVAWLKFVLTLDMANAKAVLKAHNDFRRMRKSYTSHPAVNLLESDRGASKSILWQFFVKGNKTFKAMWGSK